LLEDTQGVDIVLLCNSVLGHDNWLDILVLSRRIGNGIAAATKLTR
jgi:hypothetical protein